MSPIFRVWISQIFNAWNWTGVSHFSLNNEQKMMFIIAKKKKIILSCFLAKNWESEAVGRDATAKNKPCSLLCPSDKDFSPFFPIQCRPIPNPLQVAWTQRKRSTSPRCSSQYGGNKIDANTNQMEVHVSMCTPLNWSLLILSVGVQLLVICSFCRGGETLMVLSRFFFLLQIAVTRQCE